MQRCFILPLKPFLKSISEQFGDESLNNLLFVLLDEMITLNDHYFILNVWIITLNSAGMSQSLNPQLLLLL